MNSKQYNLKSLRVPTVFLIIIVVSFAARLVFWWFLIQPFNELSGDASFYYDAAHSIAENSSYSIDGIPTTKDVYGSKYKTYSLMDYDNTFVVDINIAIHLKLFIKDVENIISGLILAKSHEKQEADIDGRCSAGRRRG